MIKFFRNIRKKLISEKPSTTRTANYLKYAIGEIVLVVIGILVALRINTWNENRKNVLKEKAVLADIHKEFIQNKIQLDTVISYHRKAFISSQKLMKLFPINIKKDNLDSISKYLYNINIYYTFNPSQSSLKAIINTSSFDIISNDTLRNLLTSWSDLVVDYQEEEITAKGVINDFIDPFFSKNIDFNFNFTDIVKDNAEFVQVNNNLNKIIALTKPKE